MTAPQPPHSGDINININNSTSSGGGRHRGPTSKHEVIGVLGMTLILILAVHGLLIPGLILAAIFAGLYFYGKHKLDQNAAAPVVTTPEPPDVIGGTCMHCGGIAWQHLDANGQMMDVRVFHGLPPRLTP